MTPNTRRRSELSRSSTALAAFEIFVISVLEKDDLMLCPCISNALAVDASTDLLNGRKNGGFVKKGVSMRGIRHATYRCY